MGQKHRQVNIHRLVIVADFAHFRRCLVDVHKGTHKVVIFCCRHDFLGNNSDEKNVHTGSTKDFMGIKDSGSRSLYVQIGIYDGEFTALFQEKQMCHAVVHLVVPQSHHIRCQVVHDFDSADTLVLRVDYGASKHIPGNDIKSLRVLVSHSVKISAEHGNAAHQTVVDGFCKKISVHIV